jgi:hypothetical protein
VGCVRLARRICKTNSARRARSHHHCLWQWWWKQGVRKFLWLGQPRRKVGAAQKFSPSEADSLLGEAEGRWSRPNVPASATNKADPPKFFGGSRQPEMAAASKHPAQSFLGRTGSRQTPARQRLRLNESIDFGSFY